jgi:hypothetical protein
MNKIVTLYLYLEVEQTALGTLLRRPELVVFVRGAVVDAHRRKRPTGAFETETRTTTQMVMGNRFMNQTIPMIIDEASGQERDTTQQASFFMAQREVLC